MATVPSVCPIMAQASAVLMQVTRFWVSHIRRSATAATCPESPSIGLRQSAKARSAWLAASMVTLSSIPHMQTAKHLASRPLHRQLATLPSSVTHHLTGEEADLHAVLCMPACTC